MKAVVCKKGAYRPTQVVHLERSVRPNRGQNIERTALWGWETPRATHFPARSWFDPLTTNGSDHAAPIVSISAYGSNLLFSVAVVAQTT